MSEPPHDPNENSSQPGPGPDDQPQFPDPGPYDVTPQSGGHPQAGYPDPGHSQMPPPAPQMNPQMPPPKTKSPVLPIVLTAVGVVTVLCLVVTLVGIGAGVLVWHESAPGSSSHDGAQDDEFSGPSPELTYGAGEIKIDYYYDFACPACSASMEKLGPLLRQGVDADKIELTMHPVEVEYRADNYGLRAASASVCAAQEGEIEFFDFTVEAMAGIPSQNDEKATNAGLIEVGGLGEEFNTCVVEERYVNLISQMSAAALADGLVQVPTVKIDGEAVAPDKAEAEIGELVEGT